MAKGASGEIRLYVLGDARIETPSAVIEPTAIVTFATALYLLFDHSKPIQRTILESCLWPQADRATTSHRMRQTLLKLRQLGLCVESSKGKISLGEISLWTDYENFSPVNLSPKEIGVQRLDILPGFQPRFSRQFSEWLDGKEESIRSALARRMLAAIAQYRRDCEWEALENCARGLLRIVPLNEEATLALAEAYTMRGSKHSANKLLEEYVREIGITPSDLRVQATLMRRRISELLPARLSPGASEVPLVGRAAPMKDLAELLQPRTTSAGHCCMILGEAGIGKSRLLAEFAQFAALQGHLVQRVQCRPSHRQRPLSVFVELVPLLQALPGSLGCSAETLKFLDRLTKRQPKRENSGLEQSDPAWVFSSVQQALFDLVDAVSEECPIVIEIEDIHWLDEESAEVLGELIQWARSHPVIFGLTGRQIPDQWQGNIPSGSQVTLLEPLSRNESTALIMNTLRQQGRDMEATHLDWCLHVAEGNPYFLSELTNHWIETGAEHQVPNSLSAVLEQRVARLDPDALQVLQTCALLENNSTLPHIERVLEHEAHTLLKSINSLGSAGMILVDSTDSSGTGGDTVSSKHELLSNVALSQLSDPARRFLHRRIGLVLESEIDEHFSAATLWDCAKHWQLAGDNQRARYLATSCAEHLMEIGLPTAAATAYSKSLTFCTSDDQRLDILISQTVAYYRMSAWANVRVNAASVRALQMRIAPSASCHDDIELMDLRAEWQSLQWNEILQKALSCLRSGDAAPGHRAEAGVMALMLLGFQEDKSTAPLIYREVETLLAADATREATKLQARMVFHTNFGCLTDGVKAARALVEVQKASGDVGDLFRAYCNAGVTFRVSGLFDEATSAFGDAFKIAEQHGLQGAQQRALPLMINFALETGRIDDARRWNGQLNEITLDPGNRFAALERKAIATRLALYDGRASEAVELLPLSLAEALKDPIDHRRSYNLALIVAAELGTVGTASELALHNLNDSFNRSKTSFHQAFAGYVLHVALRQAGECDRANAILADYVDNHRRECWPPPVHILRSLERSLFLH